MNLTEERDAVVHPQAGIYNDKYYIPGLIERMDSCDQLTQLGVSTYIPTEALWTVGTIEVAWGKESEAGYQAAHGICADAQPHG